MVDVESYFPCNPWLLAPGCLESNHKCLLYKGDMFENIRSVFLLSDSPGTSPEAFSFIPSSYGRTSMWPKRNGEKSYGRTSILPNAPLHHFLNLHAQCSLSLCSKWFFYIVRYIVKLWMGAQSRENDMLLNGWFSYQSVILSGDKLHNLMNILERQFLRRSCLSRFTKYYQNLVENIILQIERI